ncbi:hypothetical protein E2C01_005054 [Portunus trituberculatus]|uniref:RecA family profile 1 domain-containing protein n=1 Tax=Portunus trituberculatus TaxID=210409 RepID=A0A5B7CVL5_PORTR|nr:hypothetical protein [Portunus trituberculatus]
MVMITVALFLRLESLECVVVEKDAGVVIVDSIASMAVSLSSTQPKASQLSSWASKLKSLAHRLNICVVVTNQITTVHEPVPSELSLGGEPRPHPRHQVVDGRESALNQEDREVDPAAPEPHVLDHMGEGKSGRGSKLSSLCPVSLSTPVISLFYLIDTHRVKDITAQFIPLINTTMRETVFSHVI